MWEKYMNQKQFKDILSWTDTQNEQQLSKRLSEERVEHKVEVGVNFNLYFDTFYEDYSEVTEDNLVSKMKLKEYIRKITRL